MIYKININFLKKVFDKESHMCIIKFKQRRFTVEVERLFSVYKHYKEGTCYEEVGNHY